MTLEVDLENATNDELVELSQRIEAEYRKRLTLEQAPLEVDRQIQAYQKATGETREDGGTWVQPSGALDSYPAGAKVTHGGKTWVSTVAANVWEPGIAGWKAQGGVDAGGQPTIPDFVQPDSTTAYKTGDKVKYQGKTYQSLIDNNVWSPSDYPGGWKEL